MWWRKAIDADTKFMVTTLIAILKQQFTDIDRWWNPICWHHNQIILFHLSILAKNMTYCDLNCTFFILCSRPNVYTSGHNREWFLARTPNELEKLCPTPDRCPMKKNLAARTPILIGRGLVGRGRIIGQPRIPDQAENFESPKMIESDPNPRYFKFFARTPTELFQKCPTPEKNPKLGEFGRRFGSGPDCDH